jgi:ABC-type transport system involved in multi-copper enzyme maturation permease subunit
MANFRGSFRRILAAFLAIGGALGALYSVALMATAVTGNSSPSSILLGGFGFMLLVLSLVVLVFAISRWKTGQPGQDI